MYREVRRWLLVGFGFRCFEELVVKILGYMVENLIII